MMTKSILVICNVNLFYTIEATWLLVGWCIYIHSMLHVGVFCYGNSLLLVYLASIIDIVWSTMPTFKVHAIAPYRFIFYTTWSFYYL